MLKAMHRNYNSSRYKEIVDGLKARVPEIAITSDFIVGFPTESEEEFEMTLELMNYVSFSSSYSFCYSTRPNTYAERKYAQSQEVAECVAKRRLERLQRLQNELSLQYNRSFVGEKVQVLVEGGNKQISSKRRGRTPQNVLVDLGNASFDIGSLAEVQIEHASPHGLRAGVQA